MAAHDQKAKAQKPLGRLHKGGYVAVNPIPQAVQRNVRDSLVVEDIMSEIEADSVDSGLLKLLDVLEPPKEG